VIQKSSWIEVALLIAGARCVSARFVAGDADAGRVGLARGRGAHRCTPARVRDWDVYGRGLGMPEPRLLEGALDRRELWSS
jgi:hypothetical protein